MNPANALRHLSEHLRTLMTLLLSSMLMNLPHSDAIGRQGQKSAQQLDEHTLSKTLLDALRTEMPPAVQANLENELMSALASLFEDDLSEGGLGLNVADWASLLAPAAGRPSGNAAPKSKPVAPTPARQNWFYPRAEPEKMPEKMAATKEPINVA